MPPGWRRLAVAAVVACWCGAAPSPVTANGPDPDPGFPTVPCSSAGDTIVLTASAQLDASCTYSGGIEITASDVVLDCRGATVATGTAKGTGIRIHAPADEDMSGVTVRNCAINGFLNGIRVTRVGFRELAAGEEYDHALENVRLENVDVSDTRGVGIFVDGYVTDTTITDSAVTRAGSSGIYLEAGSADNVVVDNVITDNGFGENGPQGQLTKFGGLQFRYWGTGREGISIDGSRRNVVTNNTLEGNSAGGVFLYTNCGEYVNSKPNGYFPRRYGATGNLIAGNHLTGGVSGIWVAARMGESVLPMECSDTPYFEDGLTQITLDRAAGNTIRDNVFDGFTYGVRIEDNDTRVVGNSFSGSSAGQYAVVAGTPYRTSVLGEPVAGSVLADNTSTIAGNPSPYRWVEGETDTIATGNEALGHGVGICQGASLPRGPFVMTVAIAFEPEGSPVTPTPTDLGIPGVGPQEPCPQDPPPPPPPPPPPSNVFEFSGTKRNLKRGTAVLGVEVPGAGTVSLRGTGVVQPKMKAAVGPQTIKLMIRGRGRAARKLRHRGRAWVEARVTFTPTGGTARTRSRKVKLIKKPARDGRDRRGRH